MDRLSFGLELKFADDTGTIEGYASVFDIVDRGGDVVKPGAFKASITDWKRKGLPVPMLWQHNSSDPIGIWTDVAEDDRGLKVSGKLIMDVPQAGVARALIKANAIGGLSIGYNPIEAPIDRKTGARMLKRVDLWEVSLVTFPMLREAQITGVKGDFDPRDLERIFRTELNLSSSAAVKAVGLVKKHLRDGGAEPDHDPRDGAKDMIMSLRRAAEALR